MTDKADHLPELPPGDYDYSHDYYEGWTAIGPTPEDRWHSIQLYSADQMRSHGKLCAERERERCAKLCDEYPQRDPGEDGNGYWAAAECAATIRKG
jgi:hypothetical protein